MTTEAPDEREQPHCPPGVPRWIPRRAGSRVGWSLLAGAATYALAAQGSAPCALALTGAWDVFAGLLLGLSWVMIGSCDATHTRARARVEDPGRTVVWVVVLAASTVAFFVSGYTLHRDVGASDATLRLVLGLGAVALSWPVAQTSWTLRYAHLYYRDDAEGEGGLEFPGGRPPDDYDFAYFAFTVGMTFQVSDVSVTSPQIRRAVLLQALLSFAYNTAIIALALNLAFAFFG
jgi:uncharacterized membrane protein